jgi:drug/metabolite transporter (DMT)-like permease
MRMAAFLVGRLVDAGEASHVLASRTTHGATGRRPRVADPVPSDAMDVDGTIPERTAGPAPAAAATTAAAGVPARRRLVETSEGASMDAYGSQEWALLAFTALVWGSSFFWMDLGLDAFAPGVITVARIGLGAATLALFPRARRPLPREDWPRVALLGVVWMGIPLTLFPIAQQYVDSALAGMINAGVPLTSALWATLLLRRLPGRIQVAGITIGFLGIVAISAPEIGRSSSTALGTILVLVALVLYGLATNLTVPLQQRHGSLPVILRMQLVALVVVIPYGLVGLGRSTFAWGPALAMVPLGALGTGLAFVAMATLVGRVGSARGSISIYFTPLVAIVLGVAFRGEHVTLTALVGTVLVLVGAWLTSRREVRREARRVG